MKKTTLSIFALLFALLQVTELKAQSTFTADLELIFKDTTSHFVLEVGDSLDLGFSVVNHGPDDIDTSEFVYFSMTGVPSQYFLVIQGETGLLPIPNGDTIDSRGISFLNNGSMSEEITETLCFFLRTNDDPSSFIYDPNQNNDTICFQLTWKAAPDTVTSIRNLAMDAALKISPNPAISFVNVPIDGMQNQEGSLKVHSIDGRVVHQQRITNNQEKNLKLNVAEWSKGMYILDLQSEKGIRTGRFVIQ